MKSKKIGIIKGASKPVARVKMKSALTNLDHLVEAAPKMETGVPIGKSERKSRSMKLASTAPQPLRQSVTEIEAQIDVGFGNTLFIRGQGEGLSWDKGIPLTCQNQSTWHWAAVGASEPVEFKFLLNDQRWAAGGNLKVAPGEKIRVTPTFQPV